MPMKLPDETFVRVGQALAEHSESAPDAMAGVATALGATVKGVLAVVAAEMAEHLALIEDLQDRVSRLEKTDE